MESCIFVENTNINMVKHYSNNIQNIIQGELFAASQSIKIAVAWFTNDLLFQPLLLKLATGVKIDLILNKDEINISSSINFDLFVQQGGNLYWNESNRLMHDKFCIIDDRVVITGSYNWTNKAEVNYESISVFTDEQDTVADYKTRFQALSRNFVRQTPRVKPRPIVNSGKCPISLQPYTKLKFYHSIKLFESSNTPILANQCERGPYALLDNKTFLPRTQFIFSDYSSFIPGRNYLWLKGETKWGLFDCEKLEFIVKPQFAWISASTKNGTIVQCNGLYGLVSNNGKWLLTCDYDEIIEKGSIYTLKQKGCFGIFWNRSGELIPPQYNSIVKICQKESEFGAIVEQNGKYGVVHPSGKELLPCVYDEIEDYIYCLRLRKYGKFGLYNAMDKSTRCIYDTIEAMNKPMGICLIGLYKGNKMLYGVSKFNEALSCNTKEDCDNIGRYTLNTNPNIPDLFSCQYNKITYNVLAGCGTLHFQKEVCLNGNMKIQHSLYILGRGLLLGGVGSYYSKISYCSNQGIDLIILHKDEKIRIYLINQHKELRGCYNGISFYKGVLCLKKNDKYGAYLIGPQKYIDCKYDNVHHNALNNILWFEDYKNSDKNIKVQLDNE